MPTLPEEISPSCEGGREDCEQEDAEALLQHGAAGPTGLLGRFIPPFWQKRRIAVGQGGACLFSTACPSMIMARPLPCMCRNSNCAGASVRGQLP
jgi:hypothetical protein